MDARAAGAVQCSQCLVDDECLVERIDGTMRERRVAGLRCRRPATFDSDAELDLTGGERFDFTQPQSGFRGMKIERRVGR